MKPELEDKLWLTCAGGYLSDYPASFNRKQALKLIDYRIQDAKGFVIWDALDGRPLYGVLRLIDCQYRAILGVLEGHELVTSEWKDSAEKLAQYVNYNGDEDDDYGAWLEEGNPREEHIAYHAAVVGEWDDLVWEQFQKDNPDELEIEGEKEEEPAENADAGGGQEIPGPATAGEPAGAGESQEASGPSHPAEGNPTQEEQT